MLIVVSPDHWSNFFLDNYPAVCLGVGAANEGPPEPWMKGFAHREIAGHPELALHVAEEAMRRRLRALGLAPPEARPWHLHPSLAHGARDAADDRPDAPQQHRAADALAAALLRLGPASRARRFESLHGKPQRVAVLGTGGLSHSIGEKTMGAIYEDFDHETIRRFSSSEESLISYLEDELPRRGNGSEEVRNWLVAHGAAGGRGFELVDYLPVPTVIVGCGFASWRAN